MTYPIIKLATFDHTRKLEKVKFFMRQLSHLHNDQCELISCKCPIRSSPLTRRSFFITGTLL